MPFYKNNDRLRAMLHHHLKMFTGSPYSQKEEQRLFGTRSSIQRWKTVKCVKKLISKSALLQEVKNCKSGVLVALGAGDIGLEVPKIKKELSYAH